MIQFVARLTSDRTVLTTNVVMAERLHQEYPNVKCPLHPDKNSVVEIDSANNDFKIRVLQSCCADFEAKLLGLNADITSLRDV